MVEHTFCLAGVKGCRTDSTALLDWMAGNLVYDFSDEFAAGGLLVIIPGISEPPARTLRATVPENERHIFR